VPFVTDRIVKMKHSESGLLIVLPPSASMRSRRRYVVCMSVCPSVRPSVCLSMRACVISCMRWWIVIKLFSVVRFGSKMNWLGFGVKRS